MTTRIVIEISSCRKESKKAGRLFGKKTAGHGMKDEGFETEPEIYRKHRDEEDEGILFDELY